MCQRFAVAILSALVVATAAPRAEACIWPLEEDPLFFRLEAPAGGLWWLHGEAPQRTTVTLTDTEGRRFDARIASRGNRSSFALRVPSLPPGTRFELPLEADPPHDVLGDVFLLITDGEAPPVDETRPSPPELALEWREVRVGYEGVLTSPIWDECSPAPGLWNFHYAERPLLSVRGVADDVVLDVHLKPPGEEPFLPADLREVLFDARPSGDVEKLLSSPRDDLDRFVVHARVRRIDDAARSEVVSLEVTLDDAPPEERLEWVGCTCSSGASSPISLAPALLGLAWLGWRGRRRWHR